MCHAQNWEQPQDPAYSEQSQELETLSFIKNLFKFIVCNIGMAGMEKDISKQPIPVGVFKKLRGLSLGCSVITYFKP